MDSLKPELPEINEKERTLLVDALLEIIAWQNKKIEKLEEEILKLKGETTKPDIEPSKMDDAASSGEDGDNDKKPRNRRGPRHKKTENLRVDDVIEIQPDNIPEHAKFKGFREVIVQDIIIKSFNTCYKLAQYQLPDGSYLSGKMPKHLQGCHFGTDLIRFILYQHHHQHVTQPLIHEQLSEMGVEISKGQLNHFLNGDIDIFLAEKNEVLQAGLKASNYIHTDDTGARHNGKNGYCTHIGNELFAWFESTESKSRINFLECLSQAVGKRYVINDGALEYMGRQKLPKSILQKLDGVTVDKYCEKDWQNWLTSFGIKKPNHQRIMTEGALMGGLLAQGIPADFGIISDDAGQFNVFDHALCWIHAERVINRLIPLSEPHQQATDWARSEIWGIYASLKAYKQVPDEAQAEAIRKCFDELCETKTAYVTLNLALKRMKENGHELLRVLKKPYLPLHNNLSERDIREYVKKRKISGSTRSDAGRKARDTFASLKKTCRKQGVSFWDYLKDRLLGEKKVPRLSVLIYNATVTC